MFPNFIENSHILQGMAASSSLPCYHTQIHPPKTGSWVANKRFCGFRKLGLTPRNQEFTIRKKSTLNLVRHRAKCLGGDVDDDNTSENNEDSSFLDNERLKDLEDMRDLINEAEKLQDDEEITAKQRLRDELSKRAKQLSLKRKRAETMFQMGQKTYGKGMYKRSVECFEDALENVSKFSFFGGEIQIWLAMAYDAHNRHSDCIALYKSLEENHPIPNIRRQAAELRYILDAPKLKIREEEMVTIPLLSSNYDSSNSWSQRYIRRMQKITTTKKSDQPTRDYFSDFLVWKRPQWERSPFFWVAVAMWLTLVGVALVFQD